MIFLPPHAKVKNPAILFIHGWRSDQQGAMSRAQALSCDGFVCMTFDLPGHGKGGGDIESITREDLLTGVIAAYDELASRPDVDQDDISVSAVSLGSYLASLLTEKRKVAKLALRAPANYPDEGFDRPLSLLTDGNPDTFAWRKEVRGSEGSRSLKALSQFAGPVLIIESENDDAVPHQTLENYRNVVSRERLTSILMKDAGHDLTEAQKQEYITILKNWF